MRGLVAIWRRELAALFLGPLAWTLLFLALLLGGLLFVAQLKSAGGDVDVAVRYGLVVTFYVAVVAAPLVTMRMISEESRAGLLEYLLTTPVTDAAVVTGKFLAATSFFAILACAVFVYAAAVSLHGVAPDPGTLVSGWIGIVLCAGLFCACGLLASSLTSTPIVAAFAAVVIDLGIVLAPSLAKLSDAPWVGRAASRIDVTDHLSSSFLRGAIDSAHVLFFLAWSALFLFLAVRAVETRRWRGSRSRFRIGLQVGAAAALAAVAAALLGWSAERPGLRARLDLTAAHENTLDAASRSVLEKLRDDVDVDVFFKPMGGPLGPVAYEVQERTLRLLVLLRDTAGGRIRMMEHDLLSAAGKDSTRARMAALGLRDVEAGGLVVVSIGPRRSVLRLRGDLADVDPGDPLGEVGPPRPPRVMLFRGEEAVVSALLKVSRGDTLRALFTTGHGEPDLDGTQESGLSELRSALEGDGYAIDRFDGSRGGRIPLDCAVLAIVGPDQPMTPAEVDAIRDFVESGGRLVAAPGGAAVQGEGGVAALLAPYGIRIVTQGVVAAPRATITGAPLYGSPQCAHVRVWSGGMAAMHPVTEVLRRAGRYVDMPFTRSLERTAAPAGGSVITFLTTDDICWRDLETPGSGHDWTKNPDEPRGPFALGMTSVFPPSRPARAPPGKQGAEAGDPLPECRVLCLGSALAFANQSSEVDRDLLLSSFDWATSREFRVPVAPRSRVTRRIDVTEGRSLASVHLVSVVALPGLCLVLGLLTAWRRRRR